MAKWRGTLRGRAKIYRPRCHPSFLPHPPTPRASPFVIVLGANVLPPGSPRRPRSKFCPKTTRCGVGEAGHARFPSHFSSAKGPRIPWADAPGSEISTASSGWSGPGRAGLGRAGSGWVGSGRRLRFFSKIKLRSRSAAIIVVVFCVSSLGSRRS